MKSLLCIVIFILGMSSFGIITLLIQNSNKEKQKNISRISNYNIIFFGITILLFGPYEMYILNSQNFSYTFSDFWWIPIVVFLIFLITGIVLSNLIKGILQQILNLIIFSFTLCCYIQTMFLNNKMKVLSGNEVKWGNNTVISNFLIWLMIFILLFGLMAYRKTICNRIMKYLAIFLSLVQIISLIMLIFSSGILHEDKTGYVTTEKMFSLSQRDNVIIFILDFFDGSTMNHLLAENGDLLNPLKGFTYYPNATSMYSRTYPAIPYLLTGEMCYFDQDVRSYIDNSYNDSIYMNALLNNASVGIYTYSNYIGKSAKGRIENYSYSKNKLNVITVIKGYNKMLLYRDLPYILKPYFEIDLEDYNQDAIKLTNNSVENYQDFEDEWFFNKLVNMGLSDNLDTKCFRFYHLGACHMDLKNKNPHAIYALNIIYEYIEQMKKLDIYKNSTIIVVADHGTSGGGGEYKSELPQGTAVPIFFVKPYGRENESLEVSEVPVAQMDLFNIVLNGLNINTYINIGNDILHNNEDYDRERYYYHTVISNEKEGEVALRKYKIEGDARKKESYKFTGDSWNILYSENPIGK